MSDPESHLTTEPPGVGPSSSSELDWEQLLQSLDDDPGQRKRNRPLTFDTSTFEFGDGSSHFSWREQLLSAPYRGAAEKTLQQLLGAPGEGGGPLAADSAESAFPMPSLNLSSPEPLADFGPSAELAVAASQRLARKSMGDPKDWGQNRLTLFNNEYVSESAPQSSQTIPPAQLLKPPETSRSPNKTPRSMTTEEIYNAYAASWAGVSKANLGSGSVGQSPAKPAEDLETAASNAGKRPANAAKAQAARVIRDMFDRSWAKRQAVPLEWGQLRSLEGAIGQLTAQAANPPARCSQSLGPGGTGSRSLGQNDGSSHTLQNTLRLSLVPSADQAVPSKTGGAQSVKKDLTAGALSVTAGRPSNLGVLQTGSSTQLASPEGLIRQEGAPTPLRAGAVERLHKSGQVGSSPQRGVAEQGQESPLMRAVDVAACQVALACPVEIDADLLPYDPWQRLGQARPAPPAAVEWEGLSPPVSFGDSGHNDVAGFDWLLPEEDGNEALGSQQSPGGAPSSGEESTFRGVLNLASQLGDASKSIRWRPPSTAGSEHSPAPPALHHLWAQMEPPQLREERFRSFRAAYKEEIRRLRIWAATFVGEPLLPVVPELHFVSCNVLPNLGDRHARMMMTKGGLWSAFVAHTLAVADPADVYVARRDGEKAFYGTSSRQMSLSMQHKCLNMLFLAGDLKDESSYGPEIFRLYGALHKSVGLTRAPPPPGFACQQITFPELTNPKPETSATDDTPIELIQFEEDRSVLPRLPPLGGSPRPPSNWINRQRLMSTGKGLREAGDPARECLRRLFERATAGHVSKFDTMAGGTLPTLEGYLASERHASGTFVSLGLAFCAIGQGLADAGRWEPSPDEVEQLFEETAKVFELAGNVVQILSDLRTYQADLVQLRLNAVAIQMREAHCSHNEAFGFLLANAASDIALLGAETKAHAAKGPFARACWRLPFEVCRTSVSFFTILGSNDRAEELFELSKVLNR